jgi:hypothetical protein
MNCKFCGVDPELVVLVPNPDYPEEPEIQVFSCLNCSRKHGLYCDTHQVPRTGFGRDKSTACLRCIQEQVETFQDQADEMLGRIEGWLPEEDLAELDDAARIASHIMGERRSISVLRLILTTAHRKNSTMRTVMDEIRDKKSVSVILPGFI